MGCGNVQIVFSTFRLCLAGLNVVSVLCVGFDFGKDDWAEKERC